MNWIYPVKAFKFLTKALKSFLITGYSDSSVRSGNGDKMSNVLKLIKLDRSLVKPYNRYFLIIFIMPLLVIYSFKDFAMGVSFYMIMGATTCSYTFSVAEKNDINRLYGLLPVTKKDIVTARYLFTALMGVIIAAVAIVSNAVLLTVFEVPFTTGQVLSGIGSALVIYFLFTAVQLPGYFKFGAIKGRFFAFIPLIGLFFLGWVSQGLASIVDTDKYSLAILNSPSGMLICMILLCVVIYGISLGITNKIYGRMEL